MICICRFSHQAGHLYDHFIYAIGVSTLADQLVFTMDQAGHDDPQLFACEIKVMFFFLLPPHGSHLLYKFIVIRQQDGRQMCEWITAQAGFYK